MMLTTACSLIVGKDSVNADISHQRTIQQLDISFRYNITDHER